MAKQDCHPLSLGQLSYGGAHGARFCNADEALIRRYCRILEIILHLIDGNRWSTPTQAIDA
jgi:hypothetical protein